MVEIPLIPVVPIPPKKSFPPWPLIAVASFFLGIASVLLYQRFLPTRIVPVAPSPAPVISPVPAGLKTYSSEKYKVSFQYPASLTLEENIIDINRTQLIFDKESANHFTLGFSVNYAPNQVMYLIDTEAYDTKEINNETWSVYDLSINTGLQLEKNNILYSVIYPPSRENQVSQILSTFKFSGSETRNCNSNSDCPGGYFCDTFSQVCNQELPD